MNDAEKPKSATPADEMRATLHEVEKSMADLVNAFLDQSGLSLDDISIKTKDGRVIYFTIKASL